MVKKAKGETTHYVFQGTEPIFEKRISAGKAKSYVYALGKYLARVDGVIGDSEAKKYFYHTDHVGSIRVITDQAGKVVYNADYLAFGSQFVKDGDFEELHGFTGKEYDPDIGLYYFNTRWMDPDTGRFLSEDPAGQGPNLYSYCGNNPVMRVDPTGKIWWWLVGAILGGLDSYLCGGDFLQGFVMGAITGAMGAGLNTFTSSVFKSALTASMVSGAIAGGIMGEISGEGFEKGALFGAVTGAVSWGVQKWFGNSLDKWAGDDPKKMAFANSVKKMTVALGTGQDPVEAAGYGLVSSFETRIVDKLKPNVGTLTTAEFDPNSIAEVVVLNDSTNVFNEGHTAILYIDVNGNGMYFSYNPIGTTAHGPAQMRYRELNPAQTMRLLKTGQIGKVNFTTGAVIRTTEKAERPYDRFMRFDVTPDKGSQMFAVASEYWRDPGTYDLLKHNCSQVVSNMLGAGGISYSSEARPNVAFNRAMYSSDYKDIWKIVNKKITTDFYQVYGDIW